MYIRSAGISPGAAHGVSRTHINHSKRTNKSRPHKTNKIQVRSRTARCPTVNKVTYQLQVVFPALYSITGICTQRNARPASASSLCKMASVGRIFSLWYRQRTCRAHGPNQTARHARDGATRVEVRSSPSNARQSVLLADRRAEIRQPRAVASIQPPAWMASCVSVSLATPSNARPAKGALYRAAERKNCEL